MSLLILSLQPAPTAAFIQTFSVKGTGDKYDAFTFLHIKVLSGGCFLPKWLRIAQHTTQSENFSNEDITAAEWCWLHDCPSHRKPGPKPVTQPGKQPVKEAWCFSGYGSPQRSARFSPDAASEPLLPNLETHRMHRRKSLQLKATNYKWQQNVTARTSGRDNYGVDVQRLNVKKNPDRVLKVCSLSSINGSVFYCLAVCFFRFWVGGVETMTWNLLVLGGKNKPSSLWTLLVLLSHVSECTLCVSLMSLWETKWLFSFIL